MAKPIENILIFPLESKMDRTRHRVTSNSYIRFRDSYVEYETRAIFINFSLKNFSKLQNSYLAIVFRYRQTSSNVVKHHQTSSNIIKYRQISSNVVKHYICEILFWKEETLCRQTSWNIVKRNTCEILFWKEETLCQTSWNIVKHYTYEILFWEEETLCQTSRNIVKRNICEILFWEEETLCQTSRNIIKHLRDPFSRRRDDCRKNIFT